MTADVLPMFPADASAAEVRFARAVRDLARYEKRRPPCWCDRPGAPWQPTFEDGLDPALVRVCPRHGTRSTKGGDNP